VGLEIVAVALSGPDHLLKLSSLLFFLLSGILVFFLSAQGVSFVLKRFIYSKIRLIYKTIHSIKSQAGNGIPKQSSRELLQEIEKEAEDWQREKVKELQQLKQMEQYRKEFIGNVSHELKTPLTNIQGYVLTLLDGGLEDPVVNREYLQRTERSVDRLIRIVEDLDQISQLDSGELPLKIVRFDLADLTREVLDLLEPKISRAGVMVVLQKQDKPVMVLGDRDRIRQVLMNIIHNTIRYRSPENPKTKISFFDMDENILTEVTDNGIGITAEDLPRVFERFYRTPGGRAASKKGKGLGLAIVKHIMEAHQQTINVRSTVGVGTTFGFTLKKDL
jgi:two-component system phosphate regulon sensor histidine kinase PhoR